MPVVVAKNLEPMTEPEMALEIAKLQPDLRQQFAAAGVTDLVMAHIAKATFCSVAKFQVFAFSAEGVMQMCTRLGLDPQESMENHGMAASVVLAWQNCSQLQKAITANNAEKKILGMNTLLKPAEYTTLQQQFKTAHGKLPPSELPGQTIIEQLDREIEEGEFISFR